VLEPVGQQEGLVLREVAVVEHQQELAPLMKALDRVRDAGGEVPQVAQTDVVDEVAPVLVDGADACTAGEHVGLFGLLVPMQLSDTAGFETHIHAGELGGNRQLAHGHLPRPAAGQDAIARRCEGELEVGDGARIGFGDASRSGFSRSSGTLRGPRMVAPNAPLIGSGRVGDPLSTPSAEPA